MVFCSCSKTTTSSEDDEDSLGVSSSKSKSSKKRFRLFFRRKQPLAYVSTDGLLADEEDDSPTYTPAELKQLKSTKKSKTYVDGVLYRNRNSGRRTLLSRDGVPLFSGFIDWFNRKRLREKKEKGERYIRVKDNSNDVKATTMMLRVERVDPVKSGFMGKKSDRDGTTGCAVGTVAAAHWSGRKTPFRPLKKELDTLQNGCGGIIGCSGMPECYPVCGANDDSFVTAATSCSPWSSSSVSSYHEDYPSFQERVSCFQKDISPFTGNVVKRLEGISYQTSSPEMDTIEDYSTRYNEGNNSVVESYSEKQILLKDDTSFSSKKKKIRGSKNVECLF